MNDLITRLFAEMSELITVIATKLNWLNDNKANIKLDNLPSNLTAPEKSAIRTKIDAAATTDLANYIPILQKAAANGVATLDATSKIPVNQIPAVAITDTFVVATQAAMLALTAQVGDIAIRTDQSKTYVLQAEPASTLANWKELLSPADGVQSVGLSAPTGFAVSGSPVTSTGVLALTYAPGYSMPTTVKQGQWDAAYTATQALGDPTSAVPDWSAQLQQQTPNI